MNKFNSDDFRQTMARFATGVSIVTTQENQAYTGVTINSLTSVSLDPPLVLFCLKTSSPRLKPFETSGSFMINILSTSQKALGDHFSKRTAYAWDKIPFSLTERGNPLLEGCLANIECEKYKVYEGGDHSIILGHVKDLDFDPQKKPLLFYESQYQTLQASAKMKAII